MRQSYRYCLAILSPSGFIIRAAMGAASRGRCIGYFQCFDICQGWSKSNLLYRTVSNMLIGMLARMIWRPARTRRPRLGGAGRDLLLTPVSANPDVIVIRYVSQDDAAQFNAVQRALVTRRDGPIRADQHRVRDNVLPLGVESRL